jgi:hypothetical protein
MGIWKNTLKKEAEPLFLPSKQRIFPIRNQEGASLAIQDPMQGSGLVLMENHL